MAAHDPLLAWLGSPTLRVMKKGSLNFYAIRLWLHKKYYSIRLNSLAWVEEDRVLNNH